jgi:hypothetical protein
MARKRKSLARSWWSGFLLLVVIANVAALVPALLLAP